LKNKFFLYDLNKKFGYLLRRLRETDFIENIGSDTNPIWKYKRISKPKIKKGK
jgi:hypothetical protein